MPHSTPTRFAWLLALLPLGALVPFLVHPVWVGVWLGVLACALVSVVVAFLDTRSLTRTGLNFDESAWPSALLLPPAYLVQRTRAARSTWLIPLVWILLAGLVVGIVHQRIESRLDHQRVEASIQKWLAGQGIQGQVGVTCPDVSGRRGEVATCELGDGSKISVELLGGSDVELRMRTWRNGLVSQTMASWLATRGIGEPLAPKCPTPKSSESFTLECTLADGSRIAMARDRDGSLHYRLVELGSDMVAQVAKNRLAGMGVAVTLATTAQCPRLLGDPGSHGECRVGDGSVVGVKLREGSRIDATVRSIGADLVADTVTVNARDGRSDHLPRTTCPALRFEPGNSVRCRVSGSAKGSRFTVAVTKKKQLQVTVLG